MSVTVELRPSGDRLELLSPHNGFWERRPRLGAILGPGDGLGELIVLGRRHHLVVPDGAGGEIVGGVISGPQRSLAVDYQTVLAVLDPAGASRGVAQAIATESSGHGGLVFAAPTSGRFWRRSSPDAPPLVSEGDEIATGQAIGLLEVMKTFTRLSYGGAGLPARARVVRVVQADGDDVDSGAPLLELEAL